VLYARLSVARDESVSIERQLESGRKYADSRGWKVVGTFIDDGVSASNVKPENRVGWRALLDSEGRYDVVVCWKVDRLARRTLDFLHAHESLQARKAALVAVDDPIDMTTPQGRGFATMLAVFGEMEAAAMSSRVKAARTALLQAGRRAGGRPPYGWMNATNPDGPGVVLAQDPNRIAYVAQLAARALRGDSLYSMARWLDSSGAPMRSHGNRKHSHWAVASVEAVLRNPALAGMVPFTPGRKPGEEAKPFDVIRDAQGLPVVDESVAIISTEERRRLLDILDAAKRPGTRPKSAQVPRLLAGLVRCATCQGNMSRARVGGKYESYRCANRECARKAGINLPRIEEYISDEVLRLKGDHLVVEVTEVVLDNAPELADIEAALRDTTASMQYDDADMDALGQRLANLKEARLRARGKAGDTPRTWRYTDKTYAAAWLEDESVEGRRALIRGQVRALVVDPGDKSRNRFDPVRIQIDWQPDPSESVEVEAGVRIQEL
jgi:site-specific DNA recombinase